MAVEVLPVETSRPVEMPEAEGVNTPSGWLTPEPVRNAFSWLTANL
jgi:hypothetical protein